MKRKHGSHYRATEACGGQVSPNHHKRRKAASPRLVKHPVLERYYPQLLTLRQYLLSKLPTGSQKRRQKVLGLGKNDDAQQNGNTIPAIARLLDDTIVGFIGAAQTTPAQGYSGDFMHFSQAQNATLGTANTALSSADANYVDVVDFAIWLLFNKMHSASRPPHVLCHGLQRATQTTMGAASSIPGLRSVHHNEHLEYFKGPQWQEAFKLLGRGSDAVILELVLHCGVFICVDDKVGAFYQLSGFPLSEMAVLEEQESAQPKEHASPKRRENSKGPLKFSAIRFVRHRMLYAKPALSAGGEVSLGLRHIHVLNRYPDADNGEHTVHILKYIFPRQFRLHNVFTSRVDQKETSQPFKDYTLREKEIAWAKQSKNMGRNDNNGQKLLDPVPKRLRGTAMELVKRLQRLHGRCSYTLTLAHHCPFPASLSEALEKGVEIPHFTKLATPVSQVSAYCRAAIRKVVPRGFLGEGEYGNDNWTVLMKRVHLFVQARRFENFSLADVMKDIKISQIAWLSPSKCATDQHMALSDYQKRQDMLAEFIYYIFDSFLIPLIRSNFHVTESGVYKNRLFYFRHDVWRHMIEPHLEHTKSSMFEDVGTISALERLGKTAAKASQFRLLPKDRGMRTITNLRRRPQTLQNGKLVLGRSINSVLKPAFTVLNFEKERRPSKFAGSLFSVGGIYERIRSFRKCLTEAGLLGSKLYFVKVDVKSCFDSLPQDKLLQLVKGLLASRGYVIARHAEVKPAEGYMKAPDDLASKPTRKFVARAGAVGETEGLTSVLAEGADGCANNTVFVDGVVPQRVERADIFGLVEEHIKQNLVRVGKRFYRQKRGIAQGSVLSSLLCNLLFADFEKRQLQCSQEGHSIMLRLIDDFLLVTTDRKHAQWFLEEMHRGNAEYGIAIKTEKSLTNFESQVGGSQVPYLGGEARRFPFCGILIDTQTLDLSKDGTRFAGVVDSLTVEYSKLPGRTFQQKMANTLKIHMHTMLLDTSHNAATTVSENVYRALVEAGIRSLRYAQSVASLRHADTALLTGKQRQSQRRETNTANAVVDRSRGASRRTGLWDDEEPAQRAA